MSVMLDQDLADMHYNGFCNSILWPLLHYQPDDIVFESSAWEAYEKANELFADTIAAQLQDGDLVWIHDYHLMLLPSLLRARISHAKDVKIGFFLHTPFPCADIFRVLPVHDLLVESLLQCDLVGFHTADYKRHFLSYCRETFECCAITPDIICHGDKEVRLRSFPIGIDTDKFSKTLGEARVQDRVSDLKSEFKGLKLMLGVDRLDYIKGIPQKLDAFDLFLTRHPDWIGKVILLQVAVPSRESVEEYQKLSNLVNEHVGHINGKFGTADYVPVQLLHHSVDFDELLAMYSAADVCLISSSRDGMNLVAYEYVACRINPAPELVLSEFAGAAETLFPRHLINPWDVDQFADAIYSAASGAPSDSHHAVGQQLQSSATWGQAFVNELENGTPQGRTGCLRE